MKIIVTHMSPDWDAIGSVWIIRKFLPGWQEAKVEFVPAGTRSERVKSAKNFDKTPIVRFGEDEIIHVDTGLGPLDHHQTADDTVCGTSRSWDFVREQLLENTSVLTAEHADAVQRIVTQITDDDHFKEVFWPDAAADYHDFSLLGVLEGIKIQRPDDNEYYVEFGSTCLDAMMHWYVAKGWAESEIKKGREFNTKWGKALALESSASEATKLAQKMGYILVVRKSASNGNVSIKARPYDKLQVSSSKLQENANVDLTLAYEKLRKIDPDASWFLHVGRKMLLNGSTKNPNMVPSKLSLDEIVKVIESL